MPISQESLYYSQLHDIAEELNSLSDDIGIDELSGGYTSNKREGLNLINFLRSILYQDDSKEINYNEYLEILLESNSIHFRAAKKNINDKYLQVPFLIYSEGSVNVLYSKGGRILSFDPRLNGSQELNNAIYRSNEISGYELYALLPDKISNRFELFSFVWPVVQQDIYKSFLITLFLALLAIATPYLTSKILGDVVPSGNLILIYNMFIISFILALFNSISSWWQSYFGSRVSAALTVRLKVALYDRIMKLPLEFLNSFTTGDISTRVSELQEVTESLASNSLSTISKLIFMLGYSLMMFFYDKNLTLIMVLYSFISLTPQVYFAVRLTKQDERIQELASDLSNTSLEALGSLASIRVSGHEPFFLSKWASLIKSITNQEFKYSRQEDYSELISSLLSSVGYVLIYGVIIWRLLNSNNIQEALIATTSFVVFLGSYEGFSDSLETITQNIVSQFTYTTVRWKRALPFLNGRLNVTPLNSSTIFPTAASTNGTIELLNLSYQYPNSDFPIFNHLNCTFLPGKFNVIFGPSGCGKSTLFKLILSLIPPTSGNIFLDSNPIDSIYTKAYRRLFGVVMQNTILPAGSIKDAICSGGQFSESEIWDALQVANLDLEIKDMPMQLETILSENATNISGGQRQRLAIARAVLRKPRILLEDEATSSLDNKSQTIISNNLFNRDITRVVIAHRLSAIDKCDNIVILNNGTIEAQGSFQELSETSQYLKSVLQKN